MPINVKSTPCVERVKGKHLIQNAGVRLLEPTVVEEVLILRLHPRERESPWRSKIVGMKRQGTVVIPQYPVRECQSPVRNRHAALDAVIQRKRQRVIQIRLCEAA